MMLLNNPGPVNIIIFQLKETQNTKTDNCIFPSKCVNKILSMSLKVQKLLCELNKNQS